MAANLAYYGGRFEISASGINIRTGLPIRSRGAPILRRCLICRVRCIRDGNTGRAPTDCRTMGSIWQKSVSLIPMVPGAVCPFDRREACSGRCREQDGTGRLRLRRRSAICEPRSSRSRPMGRAAASAIAGRFDWVNDLYEERRRIGSDTRGYPLKIGLASLYGKMAQRCGRGPYHDAVSAGLITAITRARLIEALGQDPHSVVMLATDAVFSTRADCHST